MNKFAGEDRSTERVQMNSTSIGCFHPQSISMDVDVKDV